jgi:magnesium chelatase family protein
MNPCPCGYYKSKIKACICSYGNIQSYARKLSGPILDRIDMFIPVETLAYDELHKTGDGEDSLSLKEKVIKGRAFKEERVGTKKKRKASLDELIDECELSEDDKNLLQTLASKSSLSPRSYYRVLSVARTIADMNMRKQVIGSDILEAFQYRAKVYEE